MALIPEHIIEQIKDRVDIVDLVSSYVQLKASGSGNHQGLCPFHHEKTPSFNVNQPRQIFHCFGCGVGGNAFSFLMQIENLSFPEAVRKLGEQAGITVEEEDISPEQQQRQKDRETFLAINEKACQWFVDQLHSSAGAETRAYLARRGFDMETADIHRLGFAPDSWEGLTRYLVAAGFHMSAIRQLGLSRISQKGRSDYDLFRGRLMFPITDRYGHIVAFGGRILGDGEPKYLNSPESPVYHKSRELYGLYVGRDAIRRSGEVIVVEGYFDQLALFAAGVQNVVATCGTALTEDHGRLLKRYAPKIILLFDQDKAGQKAAERAMDVLLPFDLQLAWMHLDSGDDPDSFIRSQGGDAFRQRLQKVQPALEVFSSTLLAASGSSVDERAEAVRQIVAKIMRVGNDLKRQMHLEKLAQKTGIPPAALRNNLPRQGVTGTAGKPAVAQRDPLRQQSGASEKAQKWLLYLFLFDEDYFDRIRSNKISTLFAGAWLEIAGAVDRFPKNPQSLLEKLPMELQEKLASVLFINENEMALEDREQFFDDCCDQVIRAQKQLKVAQLQQQIRDFEHAGDITRMVGCQQELIDLKRSENR